METSEQDFPTKVSEPRSGGHISLQTNGLPSSSTPRPAEKRQNKRMFRNLGQWSSPPQLGLAPQASRPSCGNNCFCSLFMNRRKLGNFFTLPIWFKDRKISSMRSIKLAFSKTSLCRASENCCCSSATSQVFLSFLFFCFSVFLTNMLCFSMSFSMSSMNLFWG